MYFKKEGTGAILNNLRSENEILKQAPSRIDLTPTGHPKFAEFKTTFPGMEDHLILSFLEENSGVLDDTELYDRFVDKYFNEI